MKFHLKSKFHLKDNWKPKEKKILIFDFDLLLMMLSKKKIRLSKIWFGQNYFWWFMKYHLELLSFDKRMFFRVDLIVVSISCDCQWTTVLLTDSLKWINIQVNRMSRIWNNKQNCNINYLLSRYHFIW